MKRFQWSNRSSRISMISIKNALAFRYSRDKNSILIALPDGLFDLENIRDVMEAVNGFFEGADGLLDAYVSAVDG